MKLISWITYRTLVFQPHNTAVTPEYGSKIKTMKKKSMQVKFVPIINKHSRVLDDRLATSAMLDILFDYICQTKNEKENSS